MARVEDSSRNVSHQPSPPTDDNGRRMLNRDKGNTHWYERIGKKQILIGIGIILAIIVIVLAIVLPIVLTRKSSPNTSTTSAPTLQPFITRCQSDMAKSFQKKVQISKSKTNRVKMLPAAEKIGNSVLMKNTYLVEFSCDSLEKNHFKKVTKSLKISDNIDSSNIQHRSSIDSPLFSGVSFTVKENHSIESIEMIKDAIAIYPVYRFQLPKPIKTSVSVKDLYSENVESVNSHNLTGVHQVQQTFNNFGAGVRVAVVDSGVYYKHPALGGCFGSGCKVEFGYDFVGDIDINTITPDDDPIDDCSDSSHGTHVAGIIAANTSGITENGFVSLIPFMGVAPQATLGAYRVVDCSGSGSTDLITEAIYRAYNDKADIINLSIGFPGPYPDTSITTAIQRVVDQGVYVVVAASNDGEGGVQTSDDPAVSSSDMSVASVDNEYTFYLQFPYIITPDGRKIIYQPGSLYRRWKSIVNLTIVVNDASATVDDGCSGPSKSVFGSVVLFFYDSSDSCTLTDRCNLAALQGAVGCLFYNTSECEGGTNIPSGCIISLSDGLTIVEKLTANQSAIYTFTNLPTALSLETAGTISSFSSMGPTGDLFFEPQISAIGGNVYSTISSYAASIYNLPTMYNILSGTSMACPYLAGTLALFLASIGNPSADTVHGKANNGICRPPFSMTKNILQSTTKLVYISNSSLYANTIQQGAGLVDIYHAITATTMISPSQLSLNDTIRKASSYLVTVYNIGTTKASYKLSHVGGALATTKTLNDDQLLDQPLYSADYANVSIDPIEFELEAEQSRPITLRFSPPSQVNPNLLPLYSGFIYVTNEINGETTHLSYVGMVGDYSNAKIIVENTQNLDKTGVADANGTYINDDNSSILNATEGIRILNVLAWSTRLYTIKVVSINDTNLSGVNRSSSLLRQKDGEYTFYITNLQRNTVENHQSFSSSLILFWNGYICPDEEDESCSDEDAIQLLPDLYQIQFSALKHFGNSSNSNDFDIYLSPIFELVY